MKDVNFEYDATLYQFSDTGNIGWGVIHDDRNGRFRNGKIIRTSNIQDRFMDEDDNVVGIQTRNTVYRVTSEKYEDSDQHVSAKTNIGCILQ